ncbi:sensor histidine kinase [Urbifossiella limnaea]|uniref:histidine kinase n=1 Tax=Urbifossiella limnaea TaxID=2528023 RepID=A0A517XY04_9BACT|nr:sensor histidine kinase KdpD [Urbifossiella limnaea]QDU22382.1 Sensor protein KdpD [Urbifossiella limnaea]
MTPTRPDPEHLLARLRAEERQAKRGKLKVFFGYAAGVGKTYAMLEAARHARTAGREVVVGYVEPHGRPGTEALLAGLEALPTRRVEYAGVVLREFDVDAALARRPDLILVDELAHTNAPGCRHAKRWQDVAELLEAGINVWTTLNVQHIESLNDVIGQITGVTVRETVPDRIFEMADELEVTDIPPEDLLGRLREGKVYRSEQAERAIQSFFQRSNLVALRELSLRQAARRVHTEVESARRRSAAGAPWATTDRLLVCVGPSPTTARVIRTARQLAAALDAPWLAVSVEQPGVASVPAAAQRVADHLRLAERLGAETVTLTGTGVAATLLDYARTNNVTKIFVGKTRTPPWRRWLRRGVVEELLDGSGDIDVYLIQGAAEGRGTQAVPGPPSRVPWAEYLAATGVVAVGSLLAGWFARLRVAEANVVMVFLAAVAWVAFRYSRGPAVWASVVSVLVFDVFFVLPYYSLTVDDTQYLVTFGVLLVIGLLISTLTARLRTQLELGRQRERRTLALHRLGKQLSSLAGDVFLVGAAGQHLRETTGGEVAIYLAPGDPAGAKNPPAVVFGHNTGIATHPVSGPAAHWVMTHDQIAGRGTDTLPNAPALFVPLTGSQSTFGAIAVRVEAADRLLQPDQRQWLENCASQLALAVERDRMAMSAADARLRAETEQVRSTLLSSVSHDLKTPLAAIAGASSTLLQLEPTAAGTRRELLETISEEAVRLNGLLENILQIARLDAGAVSPNKQWHVLEDVIGSALRRTKPLLHRHHVEVRLPPEMSLLFVDGLLLEQVFSNLLENAARYTPARSHILISATAGGRELVVSVTDDGPGLPAGSEERVFDRFYRGAARPDAGRGSGLGLAICRAIIGLHGGTVGAANRPGGGAEFTIRLPLAEHPPRMPVE